MISSAFWSDRRVFVTGHTGFKGSWLALMLQRLNARVTGYALEPPSEPSLYRLVDVASTLHDHRGDIADLDRLRTAMREARPSIIIHMAAQPLVRQGHADPVGTYRTNVMGTVALLEAARGIASLEAVVVVTTDKCYDNDERSLGYRETDRLGGHDPYSSSKACAELVAAAYAASFFAERGVAVVTARAGNVIGGGDFAADRILPDAVRAFMAGRPLAVRNPGAVRPWQHVLEPLHGYLLLAERAATRTPGIDGGFNFGPGADGERDVASLLDGFRAAWGSSALWQTDGGRHPRESCLLRLDTARARALLDWSPQLAFDEALASTAEWYRAFAAGGDIARLTFEQIDRHMGHCVRLTSPFTAANTKDNDLVDRAAVGA